MCVRQLGQLRKALTGADLSEVQVIAVLPHDRARAAPWQKAAGEAIRVLADPGFIASTAYGVAFQMRIHVDTSNTPGTFLIRKDGVLAWKHVGEGQRNWADRPDMPTLIEQVRALPR